MAYQEIPVLEPLEIEEDEIEFWRNIGKDNDFYLYDLSHLLTLDINKIL